MSAGGGHPPSSLPSVWTKAPRREEEQEREDDMGWWVEVVEEPLHLNSESPDRDIA